VTAPPGWRMALTLALLAGCGDEGPAAPPPAARSDLAEGVVAEVGSEVIVPSTVARIATVEGKGRRAALDAAIRDAVFAAAAREDLPDAVVASAERRVLAHAILRELWLDEKKAPVTDEELDEAAAVRWTKVDRPTGYRTVHYVVRVDEDAGEELEQKAKALAETLREAVRPVADRARREPAPELDDDAMFRRKTKPPDAIVEAWDDTVKEALGTIDHGDLEVIAQPLAPMTKEGRPIDHDIPLDPSRFDKDYAAAVAELRRRGDLTPVFRSFAGYHVAMLLEITPPRRLDRADKLEALRSEILRVRGLRARRSLVERLRKGVGVEEPSNLDALLSRVQIELDEG